MNIKRFLLSVAAVLAVVFIFESIFHGILLKEIYLATPDLWRPREEFVFWALTAGPGLFAVIFCILFLRGYAGGGTAEGVRYGFLIGLLAIPAYLVFYAVQPLPANLIVYWSLGSLLEIMLCGAVLAKIYRPPVNTVRGFS